MEYSLPKDGQVILAILKDMGIQDYEPRVLNQLLEFSYRYMVTILEDSQILASHAKKKSLDIDDVKLSVQLFAEQNCTTPPSRDILLEIARIKNSVPLPFPNSGFGALKLPPEQYCLTAPTLRLKVNSKIGVSESLSSSSSSQDINHSEDSRVKMENPLTFDERKKKVSCKGVVNTVKRKREKEEEKKNKSF